MRRHLVALCVGLMVLVGPTVMIESIAGATSAAHSPTFVGTYAVHGSLTGGGHVHGTLTVNADGTATDQFGKVADWSNSGKTITITYKHKSDTEVLVGTQTKKGISSRKQPGTLTVDGMPAGTWYAIKTA